MHYEYKDVASLLKVVAEPNRLKILEMLSCGEMCGCDILAHFNFTQPTLSHHMSILEKSGLVNVRKDTKWHYYSLNSNKKEGLISELTQILSKTDHCICKDSHSNC